MTEKRGIITRKLYIMLGGDNWCGKIYKSEIVRTDNLAAGWQHSFGKK